MGFYCKNGFILSLLLLVSGNSRSQPSGYLDHFSDEEGLYQSSFLDIIQDKKGFIWLASYSGLIRFDGYEFQSFKVQASDSFPLKATRINKITEDNYGRLWLKSNDREAYCFDTKKKQFWSVHQLDQFRNAPFLLNSVKTMPSGRVWLVSDEHGCIGIKDSTYAALVLNSENNTLAGNSVFDVLEDQEKNTWILTDNGLGLLNPDNFTLTRLYCDTKGDQKKQAFYSALEINDEIWFASSGGRLLRYSKNTRGFRQLHLPVDDDVVSILRLNSDKLILVTRNNGFFSLGIKNNILEAYNSSTIKGMPDQNLTAVAVVEPDQLWFETETVGIYKFDFASNTFSYFQSEVNVATAGIFPSTALVL